MSREMDSFDELAAELRQRTEADFRAEAEAIEADTELARLRKRTMADVAGELMSRGDDVSVRAGEAALTGRVVYCRGSLAIVDTGHGLASVNLDGPVMLRITRRARTGGTSAPRASGSFKARLAELEQTEEDVTIVAPVLHDSVVGRIDIAAADHVVITNRDGVTSFVPHSAIAVVLQSPANT